ncbi:metal ABC transporter substrate-binding protein [Oryzibacter oryziterrae]|uniref:metal ABC transporter substrate-binding protein n=1 Tax=Oryzibacter oryziterrae TaxID=2766474 RepID=UPI001F3CCD14|nr:metal ABC transporter substrate-binding protein [Oryzibacter oryziterrae]
MLRRFLISALATLALSSVSHAASPLPVVASFSILGDMVQRIGGDRVAVTTLVGPDGDAHVYEPTPDDVRNLTAAKLLVVNGLGFEGWMDRLVGSAGYKGAVTVASTGVAPRTLTEDGVVGDDPHAWQSLANGMLYVHNIEAGLIAADPEGKATYEANAESYEAELAALEGDVKTAVAAIPPERRKIITSHDAFGYFGAAYGLQFIAPEGVSTETEATAADVARIITQIKAEAIPAVFMENIADPRLVQQIAAETNATIGGTLYSDALSKADGPAATYVAMFRNNIAKLTAALAPKS